MRLLLSWARDFVDIDASADDVAEKMALRGFDVASVESIGATDAVIDFEITANRPDCLSVLGLAREIAGVYGLPLRVPSADAGSPIRLADTPAAGAAGVKVAIEDADLCPRYAAAVANIAPAGASPSWMTDRLTAAGVRPISPIVDITNYVLMELGHPMHAFDLAKLAGGELHARRAAPGEVLTTLDGVTRTLSADMLVIADGERPQALAGVMGGAASEVTPGTRVVAFESAFFKPASVRRTAKRLNLKTEASYRFERGADIEAPIRALRRAIALMEQTGAGTLSGPLVDIYPTPHVPVTVHLRRTRLAMLLGLAVPDVDVVRILTALGFGVTTVSDGWDVGVPAFRVDVTHEVDLIEEVGRHHGYDKLAPDFPPVVAAAPPPDPRVPRDQLVRRVLTGAGLSEAITFGFVEESAARAFVAEAHAAGLIAIANPLSAKFSVLRPSLLPGLVDAVSHNRRHGRRDVALFEIGASFQAASGETRNVAVAWTGASSAEHWSGGAREIDFFDLKGLVESLCLALDVSVTFSPISRPFLADGQAAAVVTADGATVGLVGLLLPALAETRGAPRQDKVFVAELSLEQLPLRRAAREEHVEPLPRFPAVVRDLSVIVADTLPAEIIRGTIQSVGAHGPAPLVGVTFFDRYKGKGLAEDSVSLSLRLTFQALDRTLTDGDVQQSFETIVAALLKEHGAKQR